MVKGSPKFNLNSVLIGSGAVPCQRRWSLTKAVRSVFSYRPCQRCSFSSRGTFNLSLYNWATMKASCESNIEDDLEMYLKGLRERANESIQKLKCTLEEKNQTESSEPSPEADTIQNNSISPPRTRQCHSQVAWQELKHSHAVNELRALLRHQEMEGRPSSAATTSTHPMRTRNDLDCSPSIDDLVPIINDQSEYIQHLEAEVKLFKEELLNVKEQVQIVVVENENLHKQLRSRNVQATMTEPSVCPLLPNSQVTCSVDQKAVERLKVLEPVSLAKDQNQSSFIPTQPDSKTVTEEIKKLQLEVENLNVLYQGKTETLETRVSLLRKDLSESQKECQQLEERLKVQESLLAIDGSERVAGLCVKCAQHEAVLARTHSDVEMKAVERLRKERDDLMNMVATMRSNINEMQAREDSVCRQVKQATEVAEEANLEKIQALVHCEQLKNEMLRQKERLERELVSQQEKIAIAKKAVHEEMRKEREALASKVTCLSENVACLEGQLQRLVRERDSACNQLEEAQNKLINHEMEINKESGELRYQLNEVKIKKEEAEKEFKEYKTKMLREFELRGQELQKLDLKLNETKCHLEHVQQDAARSKDECLKLMELLSKSEHQLHLTRMEKDSLLRSHSDDVKALVFQSQQREQELTEKIQQMEAQHDKTVNELEILLSSQNTLINKLKAECQILNQKLEKITEKNRSEVGQLCQDKEYLQERLEKLQARNDEMENQCIQHGTMHERMKQRLQQLDQHSQASAQQVMELLQRQNELLKERQVLLEKVQCLKSSGNVTGKESKL
ncbi:serologically defined colon cancer antigen 8 homolog isoform X2 [Hemiscyllium ocellatum]|uniref:serologically defined colon cancer antigen 8 homolog isoform X2 n=1 Tax=Hemiscyllium ocellatum TaxID=170820 RepID=UPI002966E54C|nr:serologically defined colon cancer antigen 8 homolog isoform X2 [Hemiscyllium ocellatum]